MVARTSRFVTAICRHCGEDTRHEELDPGVFECSVCGSLRADPRQPPKTLAEVRSDKSCSSCLEMQPHQPLGSGVWECVACGTRR